MDYQNGKVYKLISDHTDKVYIGSTCQPLSKRIYEHKKSYNCYINEKYHYMTSFDLIKLGDVDIVLIENYACESREKLHARERYWIEQNKEMNVNKVIPTRTKKEYDNTEERRKHNEAYRAEHKDEMHEYNTKYYVDNKNEISKTTKAYRGEHKDEIKEYNKQYCENNKEKLQQKHQDYYVDNKDKIKLKSMKRYESNKETILAQQKEDRDNNKEKYATKNKLYRSKNKKAIKERKSIKMTCECGSEFRVDDKARHMRTEKHKQFDSINKKSNDWITQAEQQFKTIKRQQLFFLKEGNKLIIKS